jgi:hypothetical protein
LALFIYFVRQVDYTKRSQPCLNQITAPQGLHPLIRTHEFSSPSRLLTVTHKFTPTLPRRVRRG